MHILLIVFVLLGALALAGACATPFDVLRARTEDLSPVLYVRASWKEPWLSLVPRGTYPRGAGYTRSVFQIQRSEPTVDEEAWQAIQPIATTAQGACNLTYNQVFNGMQENQYAPEMFGLMGPLICQDDLAMYWNSGEFWEKYFQALEKRNRKSVINRIGNVYRQYVNKYSANSSLTLVNGDFATQPAPQTVNVTGLAGANEPTSELMQDMLDAIATTLSEEGADEPNSNGWITQGQDGAIYPLLIGQDMSKRILLNNSELRNDYNAAFQGWGDANPTLRRIGASRVIKNFRHVINRFPARWTDCTVSNTTVTINGVSVTVPRVNSGTSSSANPLTRVPTFLTSGPGASAKGAQVAVNPDWRDPSLAMFEMAEVMNPWVMDEEVLMPVNSAPGMKLTPQNYFGEWKFVTGNDALLGITSCSGIQDPMHKQGRHFAEYRHAFRPKYPIYGAAIMFRRCASSYDTVTCS